jgi:hypothetical protein
MKTFNILAVATVIGAMTSSSIALAAKPAKTPQQQALASLTRTASAIVLAQEGPPARTVDRDQGDDHASLTAITKVCSKDTPAARRAAICPPLSPE